MDFINSAIKQLFQYVAASKAPRSAILWMKRLTSVTRVTKLENQRTIRGSGMHSGYSQSKINTMSTSFYVGHEQRYSDRAT